MAVKVAVFTKGWIKWRQNFYEHNYSLSHLDLFFLIVRVYGVLALCEDRASVIKQSVKDRVCLFKLYTYCTMKLIIISTAFTFSPNHKHVWRSSSCDACDGCWCRAWFVRTPCKVGESSRSSLARGNLHMKHHTLFKCVDRLYKMVQRNIILTFNCARHRYVLHCLVCLLHCHFNAEGQPLARQSYRYSPQRRQSYFYAQG